MHPVFLSLLDSELPRLSSQAANDFGVAANKSSALAALEKTPQSAPYHAEGPMVADHVRRVLAVIRACEAGVDMFAAEEFAREKEHQLALRDIAKTLRERADFLRAYACAHDLAKATVVTTDADGATHYPDHARLGSGHAFTTDRTALLDAFGVSLSHAKLLAELIRCHMDVIIQFRDRPADIFYLALGKIAERQGLNKELFLELLPACLFIDAIAGSLVQRNGKTETEIDLLINLLKAERIAVPEREAERVLKAERAVKSRVDAVLAECKIDAETVFQLLKTPFGPVRGTIMRQIYTLIAEDVSDIDLGEHTGTLRERARAARERLDAEKLPLPGQH